MADGDPTTESDGKRAARLILAALKRAGIDLVATLPDTWIGDLINEVEHDPAMTLVRVAREDDGVGVCAGAFLGGRKAALVAQNGGMLLSVNPLAAFAMHHQIPVLMLLVQRGSADDNQYYQVYKGRATVPVLDALSLPYHWVNSLDDYPVIEEAARQAILARVPVAVLFSRRAMIGDDKPKG
jgi:sulfopyruvate decarboxylase subunit alpha